MCPEMPFPIGANIATEVKITDSSGNAIGSYNEKMFVFLKNIDDALVVDGKLKVALFDSSGDAVNFIGENFIVDLRLIGADSISQLGGKLNVRNYLEHGLGKYFQDQTNATAVIYTVPANKRFILFHAVFWLSTTGDWDFDMGGGLQDELLTVVSATKVRIPNPMIFEAGESLSVTEISGTATMLYNMSGIEVSIP